MDTRTTPAITTTTDGLLALLWLASPALPVGGFSYSEGLEAAVDAGLVTGEAPAGEWLAQQLHLTLARAELVVVRDAMAAWQRDDLDAIRVLDAWVLRTRETSELRQQTQQMGRSMGALSAKEGPSFCFPVAWARAAAKSRLETRAALLAFAFGWAENMMQAAVRLVPLGQSAGQRILSRLSGEIPAAVEHAMACDEPQTFSPMLAILSSRHENQYSRLFRS
jgi:urease accessory protein